MTIPIFALIDCNNFYVSCERVFNPKLNNKPVAVLSNNDGCFISRSNEAKALGIPMGAPYFQYEKICKENDIKVLSSNYRLYGNISSRIMQTLKNLVPRMEVYSIDEAFLRLDNIGNANNTDKLNLVKFCETLRNIILRDTGVPVSVGIGHSKTLAKIANNYAKKNKLEVFDIRDQILKESILEQFDIKDIWGIGRRLAVRLNALNIYTAKELKDANPKQIRQSFGVIGEKILYELRDISCLDLEVIPRPKQNIVIARSFGKPLEELYAIEEALSSYVATACAKMRRQDSKLQGICVFIVTNYHLKTQPFYKNSSCLYFDAATDNTIEVIKYAKLALAKIYRPNYFYKKVGIILLDLVDNNYKQITLFKSEHEQSKNTQLMKTLDRINNKMGKNTVFLASQGIKRDWSGVALRKSPNYIGDWRQLIKAS